jgi:hypothetical protein
MTNPSTNAHNAQTQNTSSKYLAIDFSHRLPFSHTRKDKLSFIDTVDHFAYRAIGILEVIKKADIDLTDALDAAISEIEDVRATVIAYSEQFKTQDKTIKPLAGFEIWNIGVTFTKKQNTRA